MIRRRVGALEEAGGGARGGGGGEHEVSTGLARRPGVVGGVD